MSATLSKEYLVEVREQLKKIAIDGLKQYQGMAGLEPLVLRVPTSVPTVNWKWLSRIGGVREWIGERELDKFEAQEYEVTTKTYEDSIGINRHELEDDNLGLYKPQIMQMSQDAAEHPGQLLSTLLNNAFTGTGYDGKAFFATDHPARQSDGTLDSYSNKGTAALDEDALKTALNTPKDFRTPQGTTMNIVYDTLVVPTALRWTAKKLLQSSHYIHDGASSMDVNEVQGAVPKLVVNPYLTSDTAWFLFDSRKAALKPLIYQIRQPWRFAMVTDPNDSYVFTHNEFMFGIDARYTVAYGMWQVAYGSTGAA